MASKKNHSKTGKINIKKWLILFLILVFPYMVVRYIEGATHNILTLGYLETKIDSVVVDSVRVPAFNLINQDNQYVSNTDLLGKNYIINFFYKTSKNCKDHKCILMNDAIVNLKELQNKILENKIDDFKIVSISLDPEYSYQDIKKYTLSMDIDASNWDFLTGSKQEINSVINSDLLLPKYVNDSIAVNGISTGTGYYSSNIIIIDNKGYVRIGLDKKKKPKKIYDATQFADVKLLIGEIQRLSNKDYQDNHDIKKK